MDERQTAVKARARLALRAERAFGLNSLKAPAAAVVEPAPAPPATRQAASQSAPAPVRNPAAIAPQAASPAKTDPLGARAAPTQLLPLETFSAPPLNTAEKTSQLKALNENEVSGCTKCRLCEQRTHTVFGEGDADARIMFIGEGPGENEDLQGRPFVGRAGEMLNKWIAAMGLTREQVFIANIVKCRPPENREPAPDETATCTPYLVRQIEIIRPRVIITLGKPSSQYMLQTKDSMGNLRGRWFEYRGVRLLPTYHPAYVLRNYTSATRAAVWSDLQQVMKEIGLPLPRRGGGEQSDK